MTIKIKNESNFNIRRDIGVYLLKCIPLNRIYIGSTNQSFRARFSNHYKFLKSNNLGNKELQKDFNEYGENNFEFEILGLYTEDLTVKYEQEFIDKLNPYYNIRKAKNDSKTNWNKKFSKEHIEKITEKSKLYKHSKETLEIVTLNNTINCSNYLVTNLITNEQFNYTWNELMDKFGEGCNKSVNKIYKKIWKIDKTKSQSKNISLLINNEWIKFLSFEKCDKFLNKWRGYTSTQYLKNVTLLNGYIVKYD